jgi:hypothetical protein
LLNHTLLVLLLSALHVLAGMVVPTGPGPTALTREAVRMLLYLVLASLVEASLIAWLVLRSPWRGWKLVAGLALVYFASTTLLPFFEALYLTPAIAPVDASGGGPAGMFLRGCLVSLAAAPLAVLLMGGFRTRPAGPALPGGQVRLESGRVRVARNLIAAALVWTALQFMIIGRAEYPAASDLSGFFNQAARIFLENLPGLLARFAIGLAWAGLALLVVLMMNGRRLETALASGCLLGLLCGIQLVLPDHWMAPDARLVLFMESAGSIFMLGFAAALLFKLRPGQIILPKEDRYEK